MNNYHPISVLPFLSKILEKHVASSVFLRDNNLLYELQSAFRSGHSTETALIRLTDQILKNMDNDEVTRLVFINLLITLGKTTSKQLTVKQGVPQESILGPVLFLLFLNDMPLHVQKSTMDIYKDDTTLSLSSNRKTLPLLNQSLSKDLSEVERWARENKMYLNMQKTKTFLVTGSAYESAWSKMQENWE